MHVILALLLVLVACGDNHATTPDAGSADAAIDAPPPPPRAVVVAGDFTAGDPGVLSALDLHARSVTSNCGPAMAVGDDPVLRRAGNALYIVNRADGNNVTIVDATTLQLIDQLGTGAGSNPQDVAVRGSTLYVPTLAGKGVLVLTRGSAQKTEIDLSADDPDGKPNCISAYLVGDHLYVACELLDDTQQFLPPRGPGKVYVVDTTTNSVIDSLTLATKNPFGVLEQLPAGGPHGGDLVIPTVFFDDGSGCVERIATGASPAAAGCVVDNSALGGYASRVELQADSGAAMMWLAVSASDFVHANLRGYDLMTEALWADPVTPATQKVTDLAVCPTGELVVADTTTNAAGLRLYRGTTEETTAPLSIGLTPFSSHGVVCY